MQSLVHCHGKFTCHITMAGNVPVLNLKAEGAEFSIFLHDGSEATALPAIEEAIRVFSMEQGK